MFGYVVVNQRELKEKERELYRSWYCGLCHILQKQYGLGGQLSLNYDMTFLGLLLTSLYEPQIVEENMRCLAHPGRKQPVRTSCWMEYAADMNILLTYYKCLDDWKDDHNLIKAAYAGMLYRAGKKVSRKYPQKAEFIKKQLSALSERELAGAEKPDETAGLFGSICGCLFAPREDEWKDTLYWMGFYIGKFIYLMDAWDDLPEDLKKQEYNPWICGMKIECENQIETQEAKVHQILTMMMAEAGRRFERLPILKNLEILRNILYSGVWCRYYQMKENAKETRLQPQGSRKGRSRR